MGHSYIRVLGNRRIRGRPIRGAAAHYPPEEKVEETRLALRSLEAKIIEVQREMQ